MRQSNVTEYARQVAAGGVNALQQGALPVIGRQIGARYKRNDSQALAYNTNTTLIFPVKDYDTHNAYNPATGIYTAPASGIYTLKLSLVTENAAYYAMTEAIGCTVVRNSANYALIGARNDAVSGANNIYIHILGGTDVWLNTGDTCWVNAAQTINNPSLGLSQNYLFNWWSIRLDRYA